MSGIGEDDRDGRPFGQDAQLMRRARETLVGEPGSRTKLTTPCLVLDLDALDANIATMAATCARRDVDLRPHGKVHKSVAVARRQLDAGAIGICCATIGEAEVFADHGLPGLLVTGPLVTSDKINRLAELLVCGADVSVVVDGCDNAANLAAAVPSGMTLPVFVDIECGSHRTGVVGADRVVELAKFVCEDSRLAWAGLHAYDGGAQGVGAYEARRTRVEDDLDALRGSLSALNQAGLRAARVAGGGTGTHDIDSTLSLYTEIHAGSYVFLDSFYLGLPLTNEVANPFRLALTVRTSVVSASQEGFVVVDAGFKALAPDSQLPTVVSGVTPGAIYAFMGDEFGRIVLPDGASRPAPGIGIEVAAPYCATTANLFDHYCCVRGDTLVDFWPVDARGYT